MPDLPIENAGKIGLIVDQPAHDLPLEGWSNALNVKFHDGAVHKARGTKYIYNDLTYKASEQLQTRVTPTGIQDWEYTVRADIDRAGETMVLGTPWKDTEVGDQAGVAHAYDIINGEAMNEQELPRSDAAAYDSTGGCVKISNDGSTIFVGARRYNSNQGAVYVYTRAADGTWEEQALIEPELPVGTYDAGFFGIHLDCSDQGDRVVIGSPFDDTDSWTNYGAVYIWARDGAGNWSQEKRIELASPASQQYFGMATAMSGDGTRVFASYLESGGTNQGKVAVIIPTVDSFGVYTWPDNPNSVLSASDANDDDYFGWVQGAGGTPQDYWSGNPLHTNLDGSKLLVGAWGYADYVLGPYTFPDTSSDLDFTDVGTATHASSGGSMRITGSDSSNYVESQNFVVNTNSLFPFTVDFTQGLTSLSMTAEFWDPVLSSWRTLVSSTTTGTSTGTINISDTTNYEVTTKVRFYLSTGGGSDYFDIDNMHVEVQQTGALYVFSDNGLGTYSEDQIIVPSAHKTATRYVGWNVRISEDGNFLVSGGQGLSITDSYEGGVWLFELSGGTYVESRFMQEATPLAFRYWGYEVAFSGDGLTLIVNETADNTTSTGPGFYGHARTHIFSIAEYSIPIQPHYLLPWRLTSEIRWIYAGQNKIYYTDGSVNTDITRYTTTPGDNDYDASARPIWTGGVLHGVPILNNDNGVDYPQQWDNVNSRMKDLDNWPANTYCKIMRPFKNFLIALDVTKSAIRDPYLIKWSSAAEPGAVPASWDETDETFNTGEATVSDSQNTGGFIIDCLPLRNSNIVYKGDSIYAMNLTTSGRVFTIDRITGEAGLLAPKCVRPFFGQHFCVGYNDVYLFDGNRPRSIIKGRMRRWLYKNIHKSHTDKTRVVPNYKTQEMLIAFVEDGATSEYLTKALVWNWDEDTWTIIELPEIAYIENGLVAGAELTFDELPGTFDSLDFPMGGDDITPAQTELLMARAYQEKQLLRADTGYTDRGSNYVSFIERTGLAVTGIGQNGRPKVDPTKEKFVANIYPKFSSQTNPVIRAYLGGQDHPDGPVYWSGPQNFVVGVDHRIDLEVTTPYIAYRFEDEGNENWSYSGCYMDVQVIGER